MEETPIRVAARVSAEIEKGTSNLSTLVPRSERYFARLVDEYRQSQNITEYTHAGVREHIHQLMSWRAYDGFLLALLLSSHSSIPSVIKADQLEETDLLQAYEWLREKGDRISQIGAIEIGLSILDKRPKIGPYLQSIIEQIRDDKADDEQGRLHLLSALIVLVEGELSRTRILRGKPPFWRRLASIAQASLIERCIKFPVDIAKLMKWALQVGGQLFYLQTMTDLRREPPWLPDYVSSRQLKAEFIRRIVSAAQQNDSKIETPALRELLFGNGPEGIHSLIKFPFPFLPGPLEGGLESQIEPPTEILKEIEARLDTEVLQPSSFAALVNSALIFRLDSHHAQLAAKALRTVKFSFVRSPDAIRGFAQLAAKALRTVKYQLRQADNKEQLFAVLSGLAAVAAITRSSELAEELRVLTRKCRHEPGRRLSTEEAMRIGLIAAAAHSELTDWCEFVGEWVAELAFQSLEHDEIERLHSHVEQLCHIVPELWRTCGRAEAALNAAVGI
ncbi:MAG: hypothetical protein AB7P69_12480 [Candidatus Binatia bacterium]